MLVVDVESISHKGTMQDRQLVMDSNCLTHRYGLLVITGQEPIGNLVSLDSQTTRDKIVDRLLEADYLVKPEYKWRMERVLQ